MVNKNLQQFKSVFTDPQLTSEIIHMHASRSGPLLANEIYLAQQEYRRNPDLRKIRGIQPPNGTVAKFLNYWLSGLDDETSKKILCRIKLNNQKIYIDGVFDKVLLNQIATDVHGRWCDFIDAFMVPLAESYGDIFEAVRFGDKENFLNDICDAMNEKIVSLEDALTQVSLKVINTVLSRQNLPIYEILKVNSSDISNDIRFKYINKAFLLKEFDTLLERKKHHYIHTYNSIQKVYKSYGGNNPTDIQLQAILERVWRIDPTSKELSIRIDDVRDCLVAHLSEKSISPNYKEQINASLLSFQKSITPNLIGKDASIYIDGENMVKFMFELSNKNNYFLVLQEFMRGTDYKLYESLLDRYKNLRVAPSACRIWDVGEFPEFDQNFVRGFKYLIQV